MSDKFFTQDSCDRCSKPLPVRILSWFTEETICLDCSADERVIKDKLRANGDSDMEGCGYVPNPEAL